MWSDICSMKDLSSQNLLLDPLTRVGKSFKILVFKHNCYSHIAPSSLCPLYSLFLNSGCQEYWTGRGHNWHRRDIIETGATFGIKRCSICFCMCPFGQKSTPQSRAQITYWRSFLCWLRGIKPSSMCPPPLIVVADDLELHTPYLPTQRSWVKTFIYIAEAA